MSSGTSAINNLPNEILHNIFKFVDPLDLAAILRVCREWNVYVSSTAALFKDNYNWNLDSRQDEVPTKLRDDLKDFVRVRTLLCKDKPLEHKASHVELVSGLATKLLRTAHAIHGSSRNLHELRRWFLKDEVPCIQEDRPEDINIHAFLQSITYTRASHPPIRLTRSSLSRRTASAKLHVLFGVPILNPNPECFLLPYPYAISLIYDLRNYTEENFWGPYLNDGKASADWEKLEAIMIILGYNMNRFEHQRRGFVQTMWRIAFMNTPPHTYRSLTSMGEFIGRSIYPDFEDPYNVSGTYRRIVCFLDYHDLFRYNFADDTPDGSPRPPLNEEEALRFIHMKLRATRLEKPGPNDGQDYPIVHFVGESRALHGHQVDAMSQLKGTVRQTKEGEIRWQSVSIYGDEERWGSEGIQIGGIQSARGVLGVWFDRQHRETGPVGPTAFWKLTDLQAPDNDDGIDELDAIDDASDDTETDGSSEDGD